MRERSAGILLYRRAPAGVEVLLGHPGGPFWRQRDHGAWTIPKGGIGDGEDAAQAARREFAEETGMQPAGVLQPLGAIRQGSGKTVEAFALLGDFDPDTLDSNPFEMEWPPHSGHPAWFPELDRVAWFPLEEAGRRILAAQAPLLARLETLLG